MKQSTAQLLQSNKQQLLERWMSFQVSNDTHRDDLISLQELREQSKEIIDALLNVLTDENVGQVDSADFNEVIDILSGIAQTRARQGFSPRETATYVFSLKDTLLELLSENITDDPRTLFEESLKINKLMDSLGIVTFETFIQGREDLILRQVDEIADISTPVIQVWEGIVALPIIGTLDSSRTQVVMESLLQKIVESGSDIAILDISGVPAVDTLVAQHLLKTVSATRLMGAECIISGIRPEIAQTVVHLGIDLSHIITKATLANALKHAFNLRQLVVKRQTESDKKLR